MTKKQSDTKNKIAVKLSVFLIRKIWHGKIGRGYNSKMNVECRFHPSCSNYGIKALEKHGFIKGWAKTFHRIYRCRPGYTGSKVDFP